MSSVLKALLGFFVCAVVGVFVMLALERSNLAHARLTEDVRVTVGTPGRSAEAAEKEVAQPLEDALARVKGLESIRSTITSGLVVIDVRATAIGVDAPNPVTLAQQAVGAVRNQLPRDLDQPLLQRVELNPTTHHFLARSETLSRLELSRWLDEVFRRQVEVQRGVAETRFCGVVRPELKITLDQQKLLALGLRSTDVVAALQASSAEIPAGSLNSNGMALNLRAGTSSVESLQDLELQGQQVRLRDVAVLESGADQGRCWTGPSVLVSVQMFAPAELTLPTHPAVKLTPFTALRTAAYLSPPGNSVQATMQALAKLYPDAVITA